METRAHPTGMSQGYGQVTTDAQLTANTASATRRLSIWDLLRPHRGQLALGLVAVTGEAVADALGPWPLKIVLDNVLARKTFPKHTHGWLNTLIHNTVGIEATRILWFAVGLTMFVALLDAISTYGEKWATTTVGQWVTHDLRRLMYAQVQRLSLAFHDQSHTGDLLSRVTDDIDTIQSFIVSGLLSIVVDIATVVIFIVVMFHLNWRLAFISMAVVPVLFTLVYTYTRRVKKITRDVRKRESKMLSVVSEVLGSIRVVKAFARENFETQRLEGESLETVEANLRARKLKAKLTPAVALVTAVGTALVLYFGGHYALATGAAEGGTLFVFLSYIRSMYKPMQDISKIMDSYSKADVAYERIKEIVESEGEMRDAPGAKDAPDLRGDIRMEHVSFGYRKEQCILSDVNLHVEPGTTVAVVGPTGSGKSTLVNLIPRFYDVTSGRVLVDGQDVKTLRQKSLRDQISFVLQDTVLFSGSIWENIAYGNPEATSTDIVNAAKAANAMEFIDKLPEKFDTKVGERGVMLSGGQRQRIAIARAIVRNSPVLILDEPSSGLDAESEQLVFEALDRLMQGKTSIVIAHRLSTVRRASCIYVLKDGHIVESGSHDQLMEHTEGLYHQLHEIQFAEPIETPAMVH